MKLTLQQYEEIFHSVVGWMNGRGFKIKDDDGDKVVGAVANYNAGIYAEVMIARDAVDAETESAPDLTYEGYSSAHKERFNEAIPIVGGHPCVVQMRALVAEFNDKYELAIEDHSRWISECTTIEDAVEALRRGSTEPERIQHVTRQIETLSEHVRNLEGRHAAELGKAEAQLGEFRSHVNGMQNHVRSLLDNLKGAWWLQAAEDYAGLREMRRDDHRPSAL